jgi:DNA-binding beta-propeller fold protein YncE
MIRAVVLALAAFVAVTLSGCESPGQNVLSSAPLTISGVAGGGTLYAGILNSDPSEVVEYAAPYAHRTGRIRKGLAIGDCCLHECNNGMVVDRAGELFVANYGNNTITGYATKAYRPRRKPGTLLNIIADSVSTPCGLVTDRNNDLFVTMGAGHYGDGTLYEYAPPYQTVARTFTEPCQILWHAVNHAGDLFVQACNVIYEYAPPNWRQKAEVTQGLNDPTRFAFDDKNNLYVANSGNSTLTEYVCCKYDEAPVQTFNISFNVVNQVFTYLDYVCFLDGSLSGTITCFQPPSTTKYELTNGLAYPGYAIVDRRRNLLVSNCCENGHISIFKWPWFTSGGGNLVEQFDESAWPIAYAP